MVSASAATFTVSPATVAYNSSNTISLAVGGIASGQIVLIEEFADENANGTVDSGEQLLMSLRVADGELSTFPPSIGGNRPGDDDGATNGAVSKVLTLGALAERLRATGAYLFRVSPIGSGFAPITRPFTMQAASYSQAVTGTVFSGGSAVPFAFVGLLGSGSGNDSELVAGAIADGAGRFVIAAPAGSYNLLALKTGYVVSFESAPMVSLVAGITNAQDVTLLAATRTISGIVFDAVTSNGIGGLQIFAESQQGSGAIAFSDAAGNFSVAVTADAWKVQVSENSATLAGYGRNTVRADATSGSVAGLQVPLSRALGSFGLSFFFPSGSFGNGTNAAINFPTHAEYYYAQYNVEDGNAPTNVVFSGPAGSGLNNTSSSYFGGNSQGMSAWYSSASMQVPPYPPGGSYVVNYRGYPQTFLLADPDAANRQILMVPTVLVDPPGQLTEVRWSYRNATGTVVSVPAFIRSLEVRIDGASGSLYNSDILPGTTTHVLSSPVTWANVGMVQMVYNDDRGNQYATFWTRGAQPLQIVSQTLPTATVGAPCQYLFLASGGRSPYSWSVASGGLPLGLTFTPATGEFTGTPQANGTSNFRLRVQDDTGSTSEREFAFVVEGGIAAPRLEVRSTSVAGEFGVRLVGGQIGRNYSLQYSTTMSNWTTLLMTNLTSTSADLVDRSATNGFRLYRLLLNQ